VATYAADTTVSTDKSMAEIRRILQRWGADQLIWGETTNQAIVNFQMRSRQVRFVVSMPDRNAREFTHTPARGTRRTAAQQEDAYEKAVRQRWRALALVIKAKLEAVESGISQFDSEFLSHIVLPNGQTVGDTVVPRIAEAYENNTVPPMLPDYFPKAITQ